MVVRINKYLSQPGICSKRQADRWILAGLVNVNHQPATLGQRVSEQDHIVVNGQRVSQKPELVYLLYHKPVGVVCTNDLNVPANLIEALHYPLRLFAVGRLDKASEGLLLLTNDGAIFNRVLKSQNGHQKEYLVTVNKSLTPSFLNNLARGVPILNTMTLPCVVTAVSDVCFKIVLTQGLNLQIRRMCQTLGYRVHRLKRVRIMNLHLSGIESGDYRPLSCQEHAQLHALLKDK